VPIVRLKDGHSSVVMHRNPGRCCCSAGCKDTHSLPVAGGFSSREQQGRRRTPTIGRPRPATSASRRLAMHATRRRVAGRGTGPGAAAARDRPPESGASTSRAPGPRAAPVRSCGTGDGPRRVARCPVVHRGSRTPAAWRNFERPRPGSSFGAIFLQGFKLRRVDKSTAAEIKGRIAAAWARDLRNN
jgi:hypothetical protein